MEIKKTQNGNSLTIAVSGRLDTNTSRRLEKELSTALLEIESLIFDFSELEYVSSAGLRVLLGAQKAMSDRGGIVIRNANQSVMDVFDITGFTDIFNIEE